MDPTFATDLELHDILDELRSREPIFHRPEFGTTRADFEKLTAEDFWEVGASGRRYSRAFVLDELERRHAAAHEDVWEADVWEAMDFHCRRLAEGVYLLTYTLLQNRERWTRRCTIWQLEKGAWKIVYHQGTIMQET